jgi:gas vesicle protein
MENSKDNFRVVGALLIGAITGAALGILFAPARGSKTRKRLIGGAKEMAEDVKQKIKDEVTALKNKGEDLEEMASDKFNDVKNGIQQKVEALKSHN